MQFGFSYMGLIMLLMLLVPNFIWTKNQPKDYDKYAAKENKVLLAFERVGQFIVTPCALIFSSFNPHGWNFWSIVLVIAVLNLVVYDIAWVRYFKSEKTMKDFYKSFLGMPLALATYPVIAFYLLGVYGGNIIMILGSVILGIGHIGIHAQHAREVYGKKAKSRLPLRILKWIGIVILALVLIVLNTAIAGRSFKQVKRAIDYRNGVDENIYVELNGMEQYIWIMGKDTSNPIIISLHGGPGCPTGFCDYTYMDYLTDDYTFVIWDESGCGRSYYANQDVAPNNEGLTFESQEEDLDALVDYLCDRFGQDQVIIIGHSYGTMLGSRYVFDHPEKVSQYIGIGQCINEVDWYGEIYSYEDARAHAVEAGDDTSEMDAAYEAFRADDSLPNLMALRAAVGPYHPQDVPTDTSTWSAITCPTLGVDDVKWYALEMTSMTGDSRFEELTAPLDEVLMLFDINDLGEEYPVPAHFISGSDDWITPAGLVEEYAAAHNYDYYPIEGCGHSPQGQVPEQVAEVIGMCLNGEG